MTDTPVIQKMGKLQRMFDGNFLDYTSYVIRERAIPDIDDGLKPVQRRILQTLHNMDDGRFHKVANVVGDEYPEIIIRSGYLFPGTGREKIHILDNNFTPVPGWPLSTPTPPAQVFSTPYAPLVDDIDGDGLVELILVGEGLSVFVWDFEASSEEGRNSGRIFADNLNSSTFNPRRTVTDVSEPATAGLPRRFSLEQNYPNPFNPSTVISFETSSRQQVELDVFNVLGQTVMNLIDQQLPAGRHTIEFDGTMLASGVYFYRLRAGNSEATRKMVLIK